MVTDEELARINELARKKKTTGLTEEESQEQFVLRRKYVDSIKGSLRGHLENIEIVDKD